MSKRNDILAALCARLADETTGVFVTVVRTDGPMPIDLARFTQAQLPLLVVYEPAENYKQHASKSAILTLSVDISWAYLNWNPDGQTAGDTADASLGDTYRSAFLEALFADPRNDSTSINSALAGDIRRVVSDYPLCGWAATVQIQYYSDVTSR